MQIKCMNRNTAYAIIVAAEEPPHEKQQHASWLEASPNKHFSKKVSPSTHNSYKWAQKQTPSSSHTPSHTISNKATQSEESSNAP